MNELAVQASNGTNSESDRSSIQDEINQLTTEIDRVAETTKFNETYLLKGDNGTKKIQISAHDAGLVGTLAQNTTTATFTMNALQIGDEYTIGGKTYTIGAEALQDAVDVLKGVNNSTFTNDDVITIDGKSYTIKTVTNIKESQIAATDVSKYCTAGSTLSYNGKSVTLFSKNGTAFDRTAGVDNNNKSLITASAAYKMAATELGAASSIGAKASVTVANENVQFNSAGVTAIGTNANNKKNLTLTDAGSKVTFKFTKGTNDVQNSLSFNLHVGSDADMTNKIGVSVDAMDSKSLGIKGLNVADGTGKAATYAIDAIADAVSKVSAQRSALGAVQNRLEHTIANVDNVVENSQAAESRIRDTDMAEEMVTYSANNILAQAGQSMLAQANQATQGVLSLLG